ncbi:hypothetical protein BGW37DRAFT_520003 [Umbelopsis sp. PMI_123]|nr:hypothetical protein BGW37DRAFT_520003 [Umbelopsis sp. PMI_123]
MPLERVRRDPILELTGLDLDATGEHTFPIRPEISAKILDSNTYEACLQPQTFQTNTGDYPWIPVDKTRVEVPQTNLAARVEYQFDMTKSFELLTKLSMYRDTLLDARKESKKVLDIYERFDPSLGNRLVYGQLGRNAQFLAFPGGESRSTLNIAPLDIGQIYPDDEQMPQDSDFLSIDDVNIKLKNRSSLDVFTPIQQVTNFCSAVSTQDEAFLGVRTVGGAVVMKIRQTIESDSSQPLSVSPFATLSFSDRNFADNIKAVDMVGNPYYPSECIIVSETGYFGLWDYNSKPREYINNISTIRQGGYPDSNVYHKWHSCKYASHPRTIYTAYPHQLDLCDLRAKPGSNTRTIYQLREPGVTLKGVEDNICALAVPPTKHSFEVAIATHEKISLFDTRYNKRAVLSWQHHVRPFYPSQLQFITDEVDGYETDQLLAWHPMSNFLHVFEYGKIDQITKDVPRSLDLSYNTNPSPRQAIPTRLVDRKRDSSNSSFYVATRPLYGLPTNRYRPSPAAWVTPYATSKTAQLRDKSPLAGLTILPGIAHWKSSQNDQVVGSRTWNVLQLCEDGTLQSKIWCRRSHEMKKLQSISWFHRPPVDFDNIQAEHLEAKKQEMEDDCVTSDLSRFFNDLEFRGKYQTTGHKANVKQLEDTVIKYAKESVAPKTLYEILNDFGAAQLGDVDDEVIGELEKRLSSTAAVHNEKVWHNSFEEFGLIDPFALDLGDSISNVCSKLSEVCYSNPRGGTSDANTKNATNRTKYIKEAIQKIATDLTASRHVIGSLTEVPSKLNVDTEESTAPNLHFPHLFNTEALQARSQLKLNPAATALASDWDMGSDPSAYTFRRLDGMTAEEALQNEQMTTKKRRRRPSAHFTVQDSQPEPAIPQVVDTYAKPSASIKATSASLPSMYDLEFSTQFAPPSPEAKKTVSAISASQPVAGPFGSRVKPGKKKKKRKEGF